MRRRTRQRDVNSPPAPSTCEHLAEAVDVAEPEPQTPGLCQECEELGESTWAHLRMCLSCGHVGCCDSSPHKHANRHFHETEHPVMRSVEPGENWRWCYVDIRLG
ncbi:UBP-type zinc finger domain-containing protein [Mycobacterium hodleri]|uniref:UBP-type zinc finger domain-containing protein n=1 Tax=Mycolicibacterium hodleri TaxID=49897 RepID=A0A544W1X8_9MYCO|nr:UBP-type zinc finger domain-containing protein [Mycolicibacterium hodleri]TQR86248.1 UBP-type zinc finger domain-containing protein [Mycolicibacterium hodleri]